MIFYEKVFSRKESADERVKRDEWAQQPGDASLLNAKRYNGTSVTIDFGSSGRYNVRFACAIGPQ